MLPFIRPAKYDRSPIDYDCCGGPIIVDRSGYVPKEEQLLAMVRSGRALDEYNRSLYPDLTRPDDPDADAPYDPTSRKDFDIWDAHALLRTLASNNLNPINPAVPPAPNPAPNPAPPPETPPGATAPAGGIN